MARPSTKSTLSAAAARLPTARIQLLGGMRVEVGDRVVAADAWRRRNVAALVALLALANNRRLHREQVIDALWPDASVADAAPRLHKAAHHARRAIEVPDAVVLRGELVALLPDADVRVDAVEFSAAAEDALASGTLAAAGAALSLSGGELLPELLYEEWTDEPRARLRLLHLQLLHQARRWEQILELDATDEAAHVEVMRALHERGAHRAALVQFEHLGEILRRDLDAEPSAAAIELRDRIRAVTEEAAEAAALAPQRLGHFPQPSDTFLGRDADVAALGSTAAEARVVTLFGPGGVGKTRLAVEFARTVDVDVVYIDLTALGDRDAVAPAILGAVGASTRADVDDVDRVVETLQPRSILLIIDNCEHHIDDVADIATRLASGTRDVRVLVTSREALGIAGETVVTVAPLGVPSAKASPDEKRAADAVRLFNDRADRAGGLVDDLDAVGALVRRLDGIPLALELAAARTRTYSPAQILEQLDAGWPLAANRRARGPAHHGSLEQTIDWSFVLLDEAEQSMLERLSVLHGSFDLVAAAAVADVIPMRAADLLARLADKSLIQSRPGPAGRRLGLLDMVRRFAAARLDPEAAADARDRHATHFATRVDLLGAAIPGPDEDHAMVQLSIEHDDIAAAFDSAVERGDVSTATRLADGPRLSISAEGARWTRLALRAADVLDLTDDPRHLSILASAAWGGILRGDLARARTLAERALEAAGNPALHPRLCWIWPQAVGESFATGVDCCLEGARVAKRNGDGAAESFLLATAAIYLLVVGDEPRSVDAAERALELAHATHSRSLTARAAGALAYALQDIDASAARRAADEVLAVAAPGDLHLNMPHRVLANLAWGEGDGPLAARHAAEAARLIRDQGDHYVQAAAMRQLAVIVGDVDAALAAEMLGAADGIVPGIPVIARDVAADERLRERLREVLGAEMFESLLDRGRRNDARAAFEMAERGIERMRMR